MAHSLAQLAQQFGLTLIGDGSVEITGVCTMQPGKPGCIAFLSNPKYRTQLAGTQAAAVIVGKRDAAALPGSGLVADDPYVAYAHIARLLDPYREFPADRVHPSALVAPGARIGKGSCIGPNAVIAEGAELGERCFVGPNCVVGQGARIGADSQLLANIFIWHGVRIGERCVIQPGAVIGSRGFGNAPTSRGWVDVPQLGSVVIGHDVEIGANTTIDRGAIDDTVIGDGVKLDNQIQIAHNVHIGAHTAIAACTGIAGSTRIGARCMIGGAAGISGHLEITDDVVILGRAMVTTSISAKGVYGGGLPAEAAREWRKSVARIRRLGVLEQRLKRIERQLDLSPQDREGDGESDD